MRHDRIKFYVFIDLINTAAIIGNEQEHNKMKSDKGNGNFFPVCFVQYDSSNEVQKYGDAIGGNPRARLRENKSYYI